MATNEASRLSPEDMVIFYKRKAQSIYAQAQSIERAIEGEKINPFTEVDLKVRLECLEHISSTFNLAHDSLEELNFDEIGGALRSNFEELLLLLRCRIRREIHKRQSQMPSCSTMRHDPVLEGQTVVLQSRPRLPELRLPTFSGGHTEYTDFLSLFSTVIDKDPDLTDVEKLQHLRSYLKGPALDAIRSLEMSGNNYSVALDLLNKRFNNKRLIFQAHITEIMGIKKVDTSSAVKLRELSDKVNANLRALRTMGNSEQIAGCIIVHTLLQKVDSITQANWEEAAPLDLIPSWEQFTNFLEKRCQRLENVEHSMAAYTRGSQVGKNSRTINHGRKSFIATNNTNNSTNGCVFCDNTDHAVYSCTRFLNLSPQLRFKEVKRLALCLNCLRKGHQLRTCNAGLCRTCGSKHHSLLHIDSSSSPMSSQGPASSVQASSQLAPPNTSKLVSTSVAHHTLAAISQTTSIVTSAQNLSPDVVLLATAVINVKNSAGTWVPCRALLDSGSQLHIITSRLAHQLQLRKTKSSTYVSGLGNANFASDGLTVNITIQSQNSEYSTCITALVAPNITDNQPSFTLDISHWKIPSNICLADRGFFKSQRIDMLIGASLFYDLLCIGQIKLAHGLPCLQKTRLGWVVTGGESQRQRGAILAAQSSLDIGYESNVQIDQLVRRFWEVESCCESVATYSKEELDCEAHFKANYLRLSTGNYSVRLPAKVSIDLLGDSYQQAFRRFLNLERKLDRHPQRKAQYAAFIREYLNLGHMSLVTKNNLRYCKYFLPHHCVLKEESTTTKLRVVFDGSAVSSSGYSLNDLLMTGPTIQPKLFNTLLRFRTFPIALTGDICKMYRCVRVSEPDSYLQCILWRDSPQQPVNVFKLDTVTYGTRPASFLSIRSMHQLAIDEQTVYPIGSKILKCDFYVDDLITGGESIQEVKEIMSQTTKLLEKGGFKLRKWCSSNPELLQTIPPDDRETLLKFDDGSDITKTLGLTWDPASDCLLFAFSPMQPSSKHCKRSILSTIARFYDPLGLIGPIISKAKIFLQQIWKERLDWDESLPSSLHSSWLSLCADFGRIPQIKFPRLSIQQNGAYEIHGFSDASIEAYGACLYVVSVSQGRNQAQLLCSKSRVAPLKTLTVPRLELCGASLLAQLMHEIAQMKLFSCRYYCWSDSAVVLSWIRDEPSRFQIFTANRIATIQELTAGMEWRYVPTKFNPADILSRGATSNDLINSSLWLHGPDFLAQDKNNWPNPCSQHVFGYIYKFQNRLRLSGLTVDCIRRGTKLLLRTIQRLHFKEDLKCLQAGQGVKASSCIASLSPFIDSCGLLRVGGRLKNSALDFEAQHPVILPRRHPVTQAIIMHFHRRNLHAGPRSLLAYIRLQYWPIGGRKTVSNVVSKCTLCFRAKPHLAEHIMADLPEDRVNSSYAFMVTGVDYCGPFQYKNEIRNKQPIKCYICIFICFATKAVHLELVADLSTKAFLNALKRFILTRCRPTRIWSDNATNFVGAKNEMAELKRLFLSEKHVQAVHEFCLANTIDWHFIPPRSPHFGGLWEAAVKTAKYHFHRSVGSSLLNFDELRTLICHIAAIINSRPLFPLSENPADLDVLTPAHFIGTAPISTYVEPDVTKINFNRLDQWQRVSYYQQIFWARWREEYLTTLQQRSKWRIQNFELCVNDIVLVKDENLPPLKWPLARVTELIYGSDRVARVAVLKTANGVIRRAIRKLCPLPRQDEVESPSLPTGGGCLAMQKAAQSAQPT
ncbi:uncharacterized protein LOC128870561 [Anastrepha ludens]|uniref:uncharacterized protein LOC128870561 n=1 Tax=Anastrepha ludens TaxID=28586 RepID=UPI0023AF1476|nr:uncharacterized protein LOC128870561 [Anastrepha ludens]